MKKRTGNEIRQLFLDFFESKGHSVEPSQSLIPNNDPTLLWINSGVSAMKKYFDGSETPVNPRITNAQKSIRTNDIENVGVTARHHTFFEMLGNFSIGDYFKKEAIEYAWEFLTDENYIGFKKEKMYVTVHDTDEEAYDYWINHIKIDPSHILKTPGNFWEIGEGPCGPDSEIFYDRGEEYDPDGIGERLFFEELENERYTEVWNLVFSQYNSKEGIARADYEELPQRNIDTGMGLERLVSIVQNGETNFDTDFFLPIIYKTEGLAKISYKENKMAYQVIADHIRTITFALADGALFDNAGRGYVLRRILRRAVRYGKQIGIEGAFMYSLVAVVNDIMKDFYDYLPDKVNFISDLVKKEEEAFHKTLANGEKLIESYITKNTSGIILGSEAFKLYDTYGFPFELTLEIAKEHHLEVDEEGFKEELKKQQDRSRSSRDEVSSMASQKKDLMDFTASSRFDYQPQRIKAAVIGLFKDGNKVDELEDEGEIILDKTIFYAEMGGQCADIGTMSNDETTLLVSNVLKAPNGQHLHYVKIEKGSLKLMDELELSIDLNKRTKIMSNHSATHLLQKALKDVVGEHIVQAGSYVDDERLRFDFTHFQKVSKEELDKVEEIVNEKIFSGLNVKIENMSMQEAIDKGALALFSEKYGDVVRVVDMDGYSIELCGGCHVENTSAIGLVKIVSEESVGSGIRRIEAITGSSAYAYLKKKEHELEKTASIIQAVNVLSIKEKAQSLMDELHILRKENKAINEKLNTLKAKDSLNEVKIMNGIQVLIVEVKDQDQVSSKQLTFNYRDQLKSGVVVLLNTSEKNNAYYIATSQDVKIKANELIKEINLCTNGRGGGKPDFAQGGTKEEISKEIVNSILDNVLK